MTKPDSSKHLAKAVLSRTAWCRSLSDSELEALVGNAQVLEVSDRAPVCRRGDPVTQFSCLIEGVLEVSLTSKKGKRHLLVCLEPGQPVNIIPLIDGGPATHDVHSSGNSILLALPKHLFLAEMERSPALHLRVVMLLCARSRTFYDAHAASVLQPMRARCARQLMALVSTYGLPRDGAVQISLKLSQDSFADMLGCTRQSVNRELGRLEREGVIDMSYSHFAVLQPSALARIAAEEDPH